MSPQRQERLRETAHKRQFDLTVILENVHDPHNISAVMRSCDAVGIREIFVLYTDSRLTEERIQLGRKTSGGASRWMDVFLFETAEACIREVRKRYDRILATHLSAAAQDLYSLNLTQSTAFLFGNEHEGLSETALEYADGNFVIPMMGMTQSLNISVACAVTLFETLRQRKEVGFYDQHNPASPEQQEALLEDYTERHKQKIKQRKINLE